MPLTEAQALPRTVREAIDWKAKEIVRILAEAGITINKEDSQENRADFLTMLVEEKIEIENINFHSKPENSGTYITKAGIQIGFIPRLYIQEGGQKIMV